MAIGADLARGCTSGQALTGGALLNAGSWAFMMCVFGGAYAVAWFFQEGMEMSAPFFKYGLFGDEASLLVAFAIGIGFGFFLERAGFGSARKLVAQFYLTDLAVFKVMFTAIVTAMLGVTYLAWMGFLDLSLVYLVPTYWGAQVVGGLLLGVGFVVGGYCPGTSVAAVATGRIDGAGVRAGHRGRHRHLRGPVPLLRGLYFAGSAGRTTLPQMLHLPYGRGGFRGGADGPRGLLRRGARRAPLRREGEEPAMALAAVVEPFAESRLAVGRSRSGRWRSSRAPIAATWSPST